MLLQSQLKSAKEALSQLEEDVKSIFSTLDDSDLLVKADYETLLKAIEDAKAKTLIPTVSLSVLGTTSAGKSTLVNGLLGYEAMPVDIDESSAGICKVNFDSDDRLSYRYGTVGKGLTPIWETEDVEIENIVVLQNDLKNVMKAALKDRVVQEQPYFELRMPFLLGQDKVKKKLGLPEIVSVEITDLPGIKNELDSTNISVIRKIIDKTIPIVVIDYMNYFDKDKREQVLNEVYDLYKLLGSNHDAILFLLNKVNLGAYGQDINKKIREIEAQIQNRLGIKDNITVLPINAQLLSYVNLLDMDEISSKYSDHDFGAIVKNFIKSATEPLMNSDNYDDEELFLILRSKLKKASSGSLRDLIYTENARKVLDACREESYLNLFYSKLGAMVQSNSHTLIFHPILSPVKVALESFANRLKTYLLIRLKNNEKELEVALRQIESIRKKSEEITVDALSSFEKRVEEIKDYDFDSGKLDGSFTKFVQDFYNDTRNIREEIQILIVEPIIEFLKSSLDQVDIEVNEELLEKNLYNAISKEGAKKMSRRASNFKSRFNYIGKQVKKEWRVEYKKKTVDKEKEKHRSHLKTFDLFFTTLRETFTARAERWLSLSIEELDYRNKELCESIVSRIQSKINKELESLNIDNLPSYDFIGNSIESVQLNEALFSLANRDWNYHKKRNIQEKESYIKTRSCQEDKVLFKNVTIDTKYAIIDVPSIDDLEVVWENSIREGADNLTIHLASAMLNSFTSYEKQFSTKVEMQLTYLEDRIQAQIKYLQSEKVVEDEFLLNIIDDLNELSEINSKTFSSFI